MEYQHQCMPELACTMFLACHRHAVKSCGLTHVHFLHPHCVIKNIEAKSSCGKNTACRFSKQSVQTMSLVHFTSASLQELPFRKSWMTSCRWGQLLLCSMADNLANNSVPIFIALTTSTWTTAHQCKTQCVIDKSQIWNLNWIYLT